MLPAFLVALLKYIGFDAFMTVVTTKRIGQKAGVVVHSAFEKDLLEMNWMNMDIFEDDNGFVLEQIYGGNVNTFMATNGSTGKHVGFMIVEDHGKGGVHIKRMGATKRVCLVEICREFLDIIQFSPRIGTHVDKKWPIATELRDFLLGEGFTVTGETPVYWHLERKK